MSIQRAIIELLMNDRRIHSAVAVGEWLQLGTQKSGVKPKNQGAKNPENIGNTALPACQHTDVYMPGF